MIPEWFSIAVLSQPLMHAMSTLSPMRIFSR
jgi:hypothetical protein